MKLTARERPNRTQLYNIILCYNVNIYMYLFRGAGDSSEKPFSNRKREMWQS